MAQKGHNELGVNDMSGNVWEWCADWYGENYYNQNATINPKGPTDGTYRVLRGGSWDVSDGGCRVAGRSYRYPDSRAYRSGFRCVRTQ